MDAPGRARVEREHTTPGGHSIKIVHGDITKEQTEAVVNAANEHLVLGGGVAGALHRACGHVLQRECNAYVKLHGAVETGNVASTTAGQLRGVRHIIHAVGPVWRGGENDEEQLLRNAVYNSLLEADRLKLKSIAVPAISSGIFGFPKDLCAQVMIYEALRFCEDRPGSTVREVRLTNFDSATVEYFTDEFDRRFGTDRRCDTDRMSDHLHSV